MVVMAMAVSATDTARGLLTPMPTMAATVMVDLDTVMARGLLMLTTEAMAMAALATAMAVMPTASNLTFKDLRLLTESPCQEISISNLLCSRSQFVIRKIKR